MKSLLTWLILATAAACALAADERQSQCTADNALMQANLDALKRQTSTSPAMKKALARFKALADKYSSQASRPMSELMSKEDSVEFERLSGQTLTMRFYELAESRLQRDTMLLMDMHAMALKERDEGLDLAHMNQLVRDGHLEAGTHRGMNHELLVYTYLNTLKEGFKNDEVPAVPATGECSVAQALESESRVTYELWQRQLASSSSVKEWAALGDKYHVSQGANFESEKLTAEDSQRVAFLQPQVVALFRPLSYFSEMNGLRFYAAAAYLEYEWQKDDILQLGGSSDAAAYRKLDEARYAKLTPAMQRAINVWNHLDADLPSQSTLDAETIAAQAK